MLVKDHFAHYDEKSGADNFEVFAPEIFLSQRLRAERWPHWKDLFRECLAVMERDYAGMELAETFGPAEYAMFRRIVRGGFARFQKKYPKEHVPEVWRYLEGALERREKGLPDKP